MAVKVCDNDYTQSCSAIPLSKSKDAAALSFSTLAMEEINHIYEHQASKFHS
eukprot:c41176_g1_i1 orf=48-203(+)